MIIYYRNGKNGMDTTGAESEIDTNTPRRLTRSMTTKVVAVTTNINVDENRRVTRSMSKNLQKSSSGRTKKDVDTSRGQMIRKTGSRNRSRNGNTRKNR